MGTLADKLVYLSDTKSAIRTAIGSDSITDDTPFRDYASVITDKLNNIVYQMVIGSSLAITDAINAKFDSIKIFGKSTQSGTASPEAPVDIVSLDCTSATLVVDDTTLALPDIGEFRGVPVDSGGTYTDANGQQRICDYIDLARGVYVQNCILVDSSVTAPKAVTTNTNTKRYQFTIENKVIGQSTKASICNATANYAWNTLDNVHFYVDNYNLHVFLPVDYDIDANPIQFLAVLQTPIVTTLTDEQIEAFAQLYTSTSGTAISNSMGADMAVVYLKR